MNRLRLLFSEEFVSSNFKMYNYDILFFQNVMDKGIIENSKTHKQQYSQIWLYL